MNQSDKLENINEDGEVMENYSRVNAAEAIENAIKEADKGNFEAG